jgi:hypothetical protein
MNKNLIAAGLIALALLTGCPEAPDRISGQNIIFLGDADMQSLIKTIPDILVFSEKYHSKLREDKINEETYLEDYFQAMMKSKSLRKTALENGFQSMEHFMDVFIAYNLAVEFSPEAEVFETEMENNKAFLRDQIKELNNTDTNSLSAAELDVYHFKKSELENKRRLYANIHFIQQYLPRIQNKVQESE